jgi:branched-subunit amino acid transport protein
VAEGVTGAASAAVSVLVMRRNGNLIVTLVVGLGVFVLLRNIG